MKRLLVGLVALAALAEPASAIKVKMPDIRVDMTFVDSQADASRNQVFVRVEGLARPTPENLVLYPAGFRRNAVHPIVLRSNHWNEGPIALAIVYQGTSPEMVKTIASAFTSFKHSGAYPEGSQVTVVGYTDRVDVRLPWSDISVLGPDVFEVAPAARPSARAAAISDAVSALRGSRLSRKVLVIASDVCEVRGTSNVAVDNLETLNFVFGSPGACNHVVDEGPMPYVVRRPEHIRFVLRDNFAPSWYARFDVSSLDVLGTGDRALVLDIAGYETEPVLVTFPAPKVEPSWWDSRLRQIGLGALLVGLLALALRWRFSARRR